MKRLKAVNKNLIYDLLAESAEQNEQNDHYLQSIRPYLKK